MNDKEMNVRIKKAFDDIVPDVFDSVVSDCEQRKGAVIFMTQEKKSRPWIRKCAGIAAAVAVVAGCAAGYTTYSTAYAVSSTVSLDVNPSIEIKINKNEKVISVEAQNEEGKEIIGNMDFSGSSLDITVNALIGSMLSHGYINDIANSILITVSNDNRERSAALQSKLTSEIDELLQTSMFSGSVISQTLDITDDIKATAKQYGITTGKAQLINEIIENDTTHTHTFEELADLSINDLNMIRSSKQISSENVETTGSASDKSYIGSDRALSAAITHAGISETDVQNPKIELDYAKGVMVYDIEFDYNGYEYDYDINAETGEIVKSEKEFDDDRNKTKTGAAPSETDVKSENKTVNPEATVSEAEAKSIVLKHAGLTEDQITKYKIERDSKKGTPIYEIEFKSGRYEYEYDINASDGSIIKSEKEFD